MSDDLIWAVVKKNSSHSFLRNGRRFSTDPLNVSSIHCSKYSGHHSKAVGISLNQEKGVLNVSTKITRNKYKRLQKSVHVQEINLLNGKVRVLAAVKRIVGSYRTELALQALKKASALIRYYYRYVKKPKIANRKVSVKRTKKSTKSTKK